MATYKGAFTLSGMIDSSPDRPSYEGEIDLMATPDSALENVPPAKKPRARSKATNAGKVVKSRAVSRRSVGNSVAGVRKTVVPAAQKATARKRSALREQTNVQQQQGQEEEVEADYEIDQLDAMDVPMEATSQDELDASINVVEPKKRNKPTKAKVQKDPVARLKAAARGKKRVIQEETPDMVRQEDRLPKGRPRAKKTTVQSVVEDQQMAIAEAQPSPMGMEEAELAAEVEDEDETKHEEEEQEKLVLRQPQIRHSSRARSPSQARSMTGQRRKGGNASDTERVRGDNNNNSGETAALRRKLGEMTKKFENIDLKYRNLREVGIKDAEANFTRLKRQMEEKSEVADKLISSLKTELASQTSLAKESRSLEKQLYQQSSELERLGSQVAQLTAQLASSETENKTLMAKLAAAMTRANNHVTSTTAASADSRLPSSAIKPSHRSLTATITASNSTATNSAALSSKEASRAALQTAQSKEDLYSDLTGLILRNVKRTDDFDIFDCIQTGRNGTLHFKLTTTLHRSYDETEFVFTPVLDPSRDKDLLVLLPDYLTEEITFARENAERFYARVVDTLMKKR